MLASTTAACERSSGFLCVICDGSTLRRPEVTEPPRFRATWRAAAPPVPAAAVPEESLAKSEGGAGGGGGGPEEAAGAEDEEGIEDGAGGPCWDKPK